MGTIREYKLRDYKGAEVVIYYVLSSNNPHTDAVNFKNREGKTTFIYLEDLFEEFGISAQLRGLYQTERGIFRGLKPGAKKVLVNLLRRPIVFKEKGEEEVCSPDEPFSQNHQ